MNIVELETTYNSRLVITSKCIFQIHHSNFQNIITSEFRGGGIYIESADLITTNSSLFQRCCSTNFGGAFYFGAKTCIVGKCCSVECYHTVAMDLNLGGGGYIRSEEKVFHEYSSIIQCAPDDTKKYGAHATFGIEGPVVTADNVNATKGSIFGYIVWGYLDGTKVKFLNLDCMDCALLYFYKGATADVYMVNIFEQGLRNTHGAIFCEYASAQLDNIMFYKNILDLNIRGSGTISIKNSITDKPSLWQGAVNCTTNAAIVDSFMLKVQNCSLFENKPKDIQETSKLFSLMVCILGFASLFCNNTNDLNCSTKNNNNFII